MLKRLISGILCSALVLTAVSGCTAPQPSPAESPAASQQEGESAKSDTSSEAQASSAAQTPQEKAKLQLVLYGEKSARMRELLENEWKEKLLTDVNAELTVTYVPWSEYGGGKVDLMLASGEDFATYTDTAYTSRCVSKKTLADLTAAAENNLPDLKKVVQPAAFDSFTIGGKLYAVPMGNRPNAAEGYGLSVRQDLLEEVGMTELKDVADVEKFFDLCKAKHPDYEGLSSPHNLGTILNYAISDKNMEFIDNGVSSKALVFTDASAADDKLYSWFESEEFKKTAEIARRWYEKGIIPQYSLTNPSQLDTDWNAGKTMMRFGNSGSTLGINKQMRSIVPGAVTAVYPLGSGKPKINKHLCNTAYQVSAGAKDLEGYMRLFNFMQKDQATTDMLAYGIENTDYKLDGESVELISTDSLFDGWMLENIAFARFDKEIPESAIAAYKKWNDDSIPAKGTGFAFNEEPVKTEKAMLDAIVSELATPIIYGFISYEEGGEKLVSKLKEAGLDTYVAEMQKQFSAFYASK